MPIDSPQGATQRSRKRKALCHLFLFYDASASFVWNSYAALLIFAGRIRPQLAGAQNSCHLGAVMKDHSQQDDGNPYSPLMCILLLLMVGAATQLKVAAMLF
jgi:hypothetical protein